MTHRAAGRKIRRVRASDLPQISALIRNTLLVTNLRDYTLETIRALMSTFSTEAVRSLARRREMFVCEESGRLAGVLGLEGGEVFTFFVAPDRQGSGVGRALLGYVEELARERQVPSLRVSASLTAIGFYERLGYRRTGATGDGHFGRTVELVKTLGPAKTPR
jgi:GNAT superfamily N-acetyltransferase